MEHRMWPAENGSVNNLAELEKKVYSAFANCGMDAWFLVDIDPVGFSNEKVRMASVISPKFGVLTLSIHEENSIEQFLSTVDLYTNMIEEKIYNLGSYDPIRNETYDVNGRKVGKGNLLKTLLS